MSFDISEYELVETSALTIQNPRGDGDLLVNGKPVVFTLYSPGTAQYVQAEHKANNASTFRMQSMLRGKSVKNQSELSTEELAAKLAAVTASIENFPVEGGALAIYSNPKLCYIRKQVVQYLDDLGNFTKPSPTN
jgi:hypothetical protein